MDESYLEESPKNKSYFGSGNYDRLRSSKIDFEIVDHHFAIGFVIWIVCHHFEIVIGFGIEIVCYQIGYEIVIDFVLVMAIGIHPP